MSSVPKKNLNGAKAPVAAAAKSGAPPVARVGANSSACAAKYGVLPAKTVAKVAAPSAALKSGGITTVLAKPKVAAAASSATTGPAPKRAKIESAAVAEEESLHSEERSEDSEEMSEGLRDFIVDDDEVEEDMDEKQAQEYMNVMAALRKGRLSQK